jgi:hypothetical protein
MIGDREELKNIKAELDNLKRLNQSNMSANSPTHSVGNNDTSFTIVEEGHSIKPQCKGDYSKMSQYFLTSYLL